MRTRVAKLNIQIANDKPVKTVMPIQVVAMLALSMARATKVPTHIPNIQPMRAMVSPTTIRDFLPEAGKLLIAAPLESLVELIVSNNSASGKPFRCGGLGTKFRFVPGKASRTAAGFCSVDRDLPARAEVTVSR